METKFEKIRNRSANRNWRIEYIFYPKEQGIRQTKITNPMGYISLSGIILMGVSFSFLFIKKDEIENIITPVLIFFLGFIIAALGSIFHEKIRKKNWQSIQAKCLDHETQLGRTSNGNWTWTMRTLCEFEFEEKEMRCTPEIHWSKRKGEDWKHEYFQKENEDITYCILSVNPDNPHETELQRTKTSNQTQWSTAIMLYVR